MDENNWYLATSSVCLVLSLLLFFWWKISYLIRLRIMLTLLISFSKKDNPIRINLNRKLHRAIWCLYVDAVFRGEKVINTQERDYLVIIKTSYKHSNSSHWDWASPKRGVCKFYKTYRATWQNHTYIPTHKSVTIKA